MSPLSEPIEFVASLVDVGDVVSQSVRLKVEFFGRRVGGGRPLMVSNYFTVSSPATVADP